MNELNIIMQKIALQYINKHNLQLDKEEYGKYYYKAILKSNNQNIQYLMLNITDNITSDYAKYIYMKSSINGKQKRIPKNEW